MSPGRVREYVVRLRRLGNHLHEQNISLDQLQDGFLDEILARGCPLPAPTITASRYGSINTISVKRVPDLCRNPPVCLLLIYIK